MFIFVILSIEYTDISHIYVDSKSKNYCNTLANVKCKGKMQRSHSHS